jgi:hypothetical protein
MRFILQNQDWIMKLTSDPGMARWETDDQVPPCYYLSHHGVADSAWNMLALHPEIVEHWRKARCAFKYISQAPVSEAETELTLEFRWLPINRLNPKGYACRSMTEILYMFDPATNPHESCTSRSPPPMDIASGTRFDIRIDKRDAPRMILAIDMQWYALRLAALSGAAEYPDYVEVANPEGDDEEECEIDEE